MKSNKILIACPCFILFLFTVCLSDISVASETAAYITASGNEGEILISASATFKEYETSNPQNPTVNSGGLYIYWDKNTNPIESTGGSGSAELSITIDGGSLTQGTHTFTARAVDWKKNESTDTVTIEIDNTPTLGSISQICIGANSDEFDLQTTVSFKEATTRTDGTVTVQATGYPMAAKAFDGKGIVITYSEIAGHFLRVPPEGSSVTVAFDARGAKDAAIRKTWTGTARVCTERNQGAPDECNDNPLL